MYIFFKNNSSPSICAKKKASETSLEAFNCKNINKLHLIRPRFIKIKKEKISAEYGCSLNVVNFHSVYKTKKVSLLRPLEIIIIFIVDL